MDKVTQNVLTSTGENTAHADKSELLKKIIYKTVKTLTEKSAMA